MPNDPQQWKHYHNETDTLECCQQTECAAAAQELNPKVLQFTVHLQMLYSVKKEIKFNSKIL